MVDSCRSIWACDAGETWRIRAMGKNPCRWAFIEMGRSNINLLWVYDISSWLPIYKWEDQSTINGEASIAMFDCQRPHFDCWTFHPMFYPPAARSEPVHWVPRGVREAKMVWFKSTQYIKIRHLWFSRGSFNSIYIYIYNIYIYISQSLIYIHFQSQ